MKVSLEELTVTGSRSRNEDFLGSRELPDGSLAVAIADGVGGRQRGAAAARYVVCHYLDALYADPKCDQGKLLHTINRAIFEEGMDETRKQSEMATTFTGGTIRENHVSGVHIGDSRVVVLRKNGIRRLTEDHSEVARLLREGKLSGEDAMVYPRKNILERALGVKERVDLDTFEFELVSGDRLIFTTDGVHGKVFLRELRDLSIGTPHTAEMARKIMDFVISRKLEDNASVIVVDYGGLNN